jgi:Ca-activated chloride channel family protein
MKRVTLLLAFTFSALIVFCQAGSIKGTLTDAHSGEPLPFVEIQALLNDSIVIAGVTDFDGRYYLKPISAGSYTIQVQTVGYQSLRITDVKVDEYKITFQDIALEVGVDLEEIQIIMYSIPQINKDAGSSGGTVTRSDISKLPTRSVNGNASTIRGVSAYNVSEIVEDDMEISYEIAEEEIFFIENKQHENIGNYNNIVDNQFFEVKDEALSTFSIDVDRASYSIVRRYLQDGILPPKNAVRIEEMVNYFNYSYPNPSDDKPFSITTEYTDCPWNENHQLIHIGIQGKKEIQSEASPNNLVFLIDVSGSMHSADKLDLLKTGFSMLVDQLREQDKVAIVVYAGAAGVVLPPTSGINKAIIKSTIEKLEAGGSTAGGEGIKLAYRLAKENFITGGNNRVILATDGDFNVGVSSDEALIKLIEKQREDDIFLSVLGFGTGNFQDGKMEQIADKGNGNYSYIDNVLEAKKVLVKEFQSTLVTIAKDVKTQIEFNPQYVRAYRMVGYVNRRLAHEDFNNDKKDAGELGAGHSVTMIYEIVPAGSDENLAGSIDDLKYQSKKKSKKQIVTPVQFNKEIATIKLRYKEPTEDKSKLITHVIPTKKIAWNEATNNCRFSASVVQFGMLLRESDYMDNTNYEKTMSLAKSAKGEDGEGYRSEFIKLVETAMLLKNE